MFEKFTEQARQAVAFAQEEARALKQNYIGTEHILLGLLRADGLAAQVLESLNVTLVRARTEVVRIVGSGDATTGQIPFTPRAKKVLEYAMREALSFGHNFIGTEHILLGLARENEGVASRILLDVGADAETIRNEVIDRLPGPGPDPGRNARPVSQPGAGQAIDSTWLGGLGGVLNDLAAEIHHELERAPDNGDLLLALAAAPETLAGQALRALGIELDQLAAVVDRLRSEDELAREIQELAQAKQRAIASLDQLRAQERGLRERAQARTVIAPGVIQELRGQLGIPTAQMDNPPPPEPAG